LGVSNFSVDVYREILNSLDFTGKTNIHVDVIQRPIACNELTLRMTGAIQAGTSPYDVLDLEDATAIPFMHAGWLLPLDELIGSEVWADYTPPLLALTKIWDQYRGQTFRIHHNFELCYWWYRKDWFETRGLTIPKTWDHVKQMGQVFRNKNKGIWATAEGMQQNSFLDVYTAWITLQAGGNLYDVDESFRSALAYIYDLMYTSQTLNPKCLVKNYDQQNSDYFADRVAFMRQWPFFYDVALKEYPQWYTPDKIACHLPPVGPGGKAVSTYAAGWGYSIPKTAPNVEAAKELVKFLIANENVTQMIPYSTWFLNARHSILKAAGNEGLAKYLKMYMDAGVIANR
ncbi:MAG: extracellular solute-binding protein, partial [Bacteroidales bacterium]|nr:extracellular solute-binding protein [Bacteroidales bacterium]